MPGMGNKGAETRNDQDVYEHLPWLLRSFVRVAPLVTMWTSCEISICRPNKAYTAINTAVIADGLKSRQKPDTLPCLLGRTEAWCRKRGTELFESSLGKVILYLQGHCLQKIDIFISESVWICQVSPSAMAYQ